ncbi:MAG: enoyl-[acyl-carrier-protein] reductase FabK [Clostridiales bacterium]|nr:enoyl-[acyl-carrier-protein] reductase FabK [Clostridiales bacterium]
MRTLICDILGIKYPIIQGGMAWVANASLASAVSNAGGLGIIAAMNSNASQLKEEIDKCKNLTDKPFGVNIMLLSPYKDEVAQVVIDEKIPVVTTGAGNPSKYMEAWLKAGIKVIPVVASTGMAKMVERYGATAVVAEGNEAGGHIGEITTLCLVPQVCDAVKIPVIAAGGIGDGRGVAAAFMLGAVGVQLGTKFLVVNECTIHRNYKERVLRAKDIDTISTGKRLGHPVRALKSPFTHEFFKCEYNPDVTNENLETMGAGSLRVAVLDGDEEKGSFMAGQIAGMIKKEQPAKEMIEELFAEAEQVLQGASKWVK